MKDTNPFLTMLMQIRPQLLWDLMFCLPGKVTGYDPDLQRAIVEIGIQRHEGEGVFNTLPEIKHVPVQFSGTAQWSVFHELPEGTEGLIHFSQRSVDYWIEQGGPVRPLDARMYTPANYFVGADDYVSNISIGTAAGEINKSVIPVKFNQLGVFSTENITINYV